MSNDGPSEGPQVSEPAGRDGPAYGAGEAPPRLGDAIPATSNPDLEDEKLTHREKAALWLLRRLGADPDETIVEEEGRWPTTWQSFLWDLAPDKVAPRRDGVVLPAWVEPQWLADLPRSRVEEAGELVRAERDRLLQSISGVELKASRLLTPFVALLTGAIALTIFQAAAVGTSFWGVLATAGFAASGVGVGFLLMGMLRALDADTRLGTSLRATLEQELSTDHPRVALRSDHQGVDAARFIHRMKATRILYARAAISRGSLMLVVAAVLGALVLAFAPNDSDARKPSRDHFLRGRHEPQGAHSPGGAPSDRANPAPTPLPPTPGVRPTKLKSGQNSELNNAKAYPKTVDYGDAI